MAEIREQVYQKRQYRSPNKSPLSKSSTMAKKRSTTSISQSELERLRALEEKHLAAAVKVAQQEKELEKLKEQLNENSGVKSVSPVAASPASTSSTSSSYTGNTLAVSTNKDLIIENLKAKIDNLMHSKNGKHPKTGALNAELIGQIQTACKVYMFRKYKFVENGEDAAALAKEILQYITAPMPKEEFVRDYYYVCAQKIGKARHYRMQQAGPAAHCKSLVLYVSYELCYKLCYEVSCGVSCRVVRSFVVTNGK